MIKEAVWTGGAAMGVIVCLMALGCGKSGSEFPVARLEGTVTINGRPLPADAEGWVQFMPSGGGGQASPARSQIVDGRYLAENVPLGKILVIFTVTRLTGRMVVEDNVPGGTPDPERENLVPESCRQGIPLEISGDEEKRDFDLQG